MKQEKSCGCIIIDDQKVLVISTQDDEGNLFWSFPKGHQEPGETDLETALRETREEVGLKVEIFDQNPITTSHPVKNNTAIKEILFFLARPSKNSPKLTLQAEEVVSAEWRTFAETTKLLSSSLSYYSDVWQEALARLN